MRNKIIAVNATIVLIVGLLAFAILRQSLLGAVTNPERIKSAAEREVRAVAAQLELDGLRVERWLGNKAAQPASADVFKAAREDSRGDAATTLCDAIVGSAKTTFNTAPSLVMVVDRNGKIVGRNGSPLERGDDVGESYPFLKASLAKGVGGSDVWVSRKTDQYVVSYAPIRHAGGIGMLVIGMPLNDSMTRVAAMTSGTGVALYVSDGKDVRMAASTTEAAKQSATIALNEVKTSLSSGDAAVGETSNMVFAATPIGGFGDGKHVAVVTTSGTSLIANPTALLAWPLGGVTVLGLVLVLVGSFFLGAYISRPIDMLEEGLLAIVNGQSDKRFNLEHDELGGLAFRIDQLLNTLMGIEEDTSDEQGRLSRPPTPATYVDGTIALPPAPGAGASPVVVEPAELYYLRLYNEYIAAKRAIGEPVDHITEPLFRSRIQAMEVEAALKHGRPVRYQVQQAGREVQLLAVPVS